VAFSVPSVCLLKTGFRDRNLVWILAVFGVAACESVAGHDVLWASRKTGDSAPCFAIDEPSFRGECMVLAAHEQALAGNVDEALAICQSVEERVWKEECPFLVADTSGAHGDGAAKICAEAGRFRGPCIGHAVHREAQEVFQRTGHGGEMAALARLRVVVKQYSGMGGGPGMTAEKLLVNHIVQRGQGQPMSLALCGSADLSLCQAAFVERVRRGVEHGGLAWDQVCKAKGDQVAIEALGLVGWREDAEELVFAGWKEICGSDWTMGG